MADTTIGPGSVLAGRFVLEDLLDETEGAKFWRATDKILARNVAVHVLRSDDPRAPGLLSAARTSATVTDGHLLRVLDAASEDGYTYVVNEWGNGISLDRLLVEGPLTARRAAWVTKEVAEAISAAHRHGIAHGRLIPENVMVTESGSVKLIGFVVEAVLRGREIGRGADGTPLGEHEADVVNLAALLYAGLVARWPGTDGSSVTKAPVEGGRPLRPRRVRAGVPRPLDAICERVLNGDAHGSVRLGTAHEVYAALCDYIGDPAAPAPLGEPQGVLDDEDSARRTAVADVGEETQAAGPGTTGLPVTPAAPGDDPERTQIGAPVFDDAPADSPGDPEPTRVVTPPPPPAEPEPRPLFASDQPRAPRPQPGGPRSTGAGNGAIPPVWGPDAETPHTAGGGKHRDDAAWAAEPPGRSWLQLAAAIAGVLAVVIAIVFAFTLGRNSTAPEDEAGSDPTQPAAQQRPQPVEIAVVADFDPPPGDGQENPETAPLAIDGNATTAWRTSIYFSELSLQKPGVGLMLDLGKPVEVSDVRLTLIGSGTDVELRAAPGAQTAPTALDQLDQVAGATGAAEQVTLSPERPVRSRFLLVWLTGLPEVEGGFRGQVAEIVVRS